MYRNHYETEPDVYAACNGCINLIKGTYYGSPYKACKCGIGNPNSCTLLKRRFKKNQVVTDCINKKERKREMKKQLYKEPLKKIVSARLKELREEKGLTQSALERALKNRILQSAISCYERGKILPSVKVIGMLAKFFKVSPAYIYGYSDKRKLTLIDRIKGLFGQSYAL